MVGCWALTISSPRHPRRCPSNKRSAHQARALVIEAPAGNQELHGHAVIARPQAHALVAFVGLGHGVHVDLHAQARFGRHLDVTVDICNGALVRRWPSCQIQWVSIAVIAPGAAAATWVNIAREMSKWLLECEPQVRPHS